MGRPVKVRPITSKLASTLASKRVNLAAQTTWILEFAYGTATFMAAEQLELSSDLADGSRGSKRRRNSRSYVGVYFVCCDVYARIYINCEQTAYIGNCPKCAKPVRLRIDPGGTDARFFTAR